MSWKKYFTPVEGDNGASSPLTMTGQQPGPARSNYSSYLPDVYTGAPNRTERYGQYNTKLLILDLLRKTHLRI